MSSGPARRGEPADLARQARALLLRVRDSRWSGFTPPAPPAAGVTAQGPLFGACSPGDRHPWETLEQIARAVHACTKCPLHATRTTAVPGEGDPRARLMFVGEAPGAEEDRQGRPFVGASGELLDRMIAAMGLARGDVFIANILKCRPPGNRDPAPEEVSSCMPYLQAQIALVAPEVICSLGKHSAQTLLGRKDPISRLRGRFFDLRGMSLMPTFHPSYLLRTPADKASAWKDLQQIMQRLRLPHPAAGSRGSG